MGNDCMALKPPQPFPSVTLPPARPRLLNLPKQFSQLRRSFQISEPNEGEAFLVKALLCQRLWVRTV